MEGMLAIFRFTAHLHYCRWECIGHHCTFALSLFSLLRRLPHVKRLYDHAVNMNSESVKELLKLRNSALVCRHSKRKGICDFAFLTSGGKFYKFLMTVVLTIPPLTMEIWPCALIRACALNRKNTVSAFQIAWCLIS